MTPRNNVSRLFEGRSSVPDAMAQHLKVNEDISQIPNDWPSYSPEDCKYMADAAYSHAQNGVLYSPLQELIDHKAELAAAAAKTPTETDQSSESKETSLLSSLASGLARRLRRLRKNN